MNYGILVPEVVWPCWAYALRRSGFNIPLTKEWVHDVMPRKLETFKPSLSYSSGDIFVWANHNAWVRDCPIYISNGFGGPVIWEKAKYDYHAAVHETTVLNNDMSYDIVISDMIVNDGADALPFIIRMRKLSEASQPDFVLTKEILMSMHVNPQGDD